MSILTIVVLLIVVIIIVIKMWFKILKNCDKKGYVNTHFGIDDNFIDLNYQPLSRKSMLNNSNEFFETMTKRRSVRHFSPRRVPDDVLRNVIKTAGTSPSGANTQPWTFLIVKNKDQKTFIREIIEFEEKINYEQRMFKDWVDDLKPLKTNWIKEYLTQAPILILVFKQTYHFNGDGVKKYHYYNEFSTSIATGILLCALQVSGLCSLITTPMNCGLRLRELFGRPLNEKLQFLIPIGYPAEDCHVPNIKRKPLEDILIEC